MTKMLALVTGANRGIGKEVSKQLAEQGYRVIMTSRSEDSGKSAAKEISAYGDVLYHQLDITDQESVDGVKEYIIAEHGGKLDVLVNNAGINYDTYHNALNADLAEVTETIETNLFGPWRVSQALVPFMQQNGFGRVVNVSSGAGSIHGQSGGSPPGYSMSKASLNVLTIQTSGLVGGSDIKVNSVCPGWVRTDMGGSHASRSVEEGARSVVWAATLDKDGPTGGFFRDGKPIEW